MNHHRHWLALLLWPIAIDAQAAEVRIKDPSPDGKFALRAGREEGDMAIVNKATGKTVQTLAWMGNPSPFDARLYWSADSQRVAHAMPHRRWTDLGIYFRHACLLAWLTRVKLGEKDAADQQLATSLGAKHLESSDLETALARHALGQMTEEGLLKVAASSEALTYPECEAWFLIGFQQTLAGDKSRAAESFQKSLAAAQQKLPPQCWLPPESRLAAQELKALDAPP
jgi:hypothetical protein